jgi:hypothetical protein
MTSALHLPDDTTRLFLNGNNGHPLLHKTCPGDRHLTKELPPIINEFEKVIGEEIVNAVVFDGEGCSIDVFRAFDGLNKGREKKIYPVTVLDSNQYRWEDFKIPEGNGKRKAHCNRYDRTGRGAWLRSRACRPLL